MGNGGAKFANRAMPSAFFVSDGFSVIPTFWDDLGRGAKETASSAVA